MKLYKIIKRFLIIFIISCIVIVTSIYSCILYNALEAHPKKSDVIIVLGCQVDSMTPSLMLKNRLEKALELYNKGYAGYIIVSGGKGANEINFEAVVMKNWLIAHGVGSSKIYEENKSSNTYENLKFSKVISDKEGFKTAIIVSNDFHIFRSLMTARKLGISASGAPAPTVWYLVPSSNVKEILSVIKSFVLNRI